jgi:hypothetical protein
MLVVIPGCGGKDLFPVHGHVAYKDGSDISVLAGGWITFVPVDPEVTKVSAQGEIKEDGSFEMSTSRDGDGVAPGTYKVLVAPPRFKGKRFEKPPQLLDEHFKDLKEADIQITVTAPVNDFAITVHKPLAH